MNKETFSQESNEAQVFVSRNVKVTGWIASEYMLRSSDLSPGARQRGSSFSSTFVSSECDETMQNYTRSCSFTAHFQTPFINGQKAVFWASSDCQRRAGLGAKTEQERERAIK